MNILPIFELPVIVNFDDNPIQGDDPIPNECALGCGVGCLGGCAAGVGCNS